jgi:hypothetical protein
MNGEVEVKFHGLSERRAQSPKTDNNKYGHDPIGHYFDLYHIPPHEESK